MFEKPLAIVDVETTGTNSFYHRIIEIAVLRVEHGAIVGTFHSLVNPGRYVSPVITQITGITNEDLASAPPFEEVADEVKEALDDALFVAHNARFDYGFVKREFEHLGIPFSAKCLCTVRLSRKLFPRARSHSLDSVIRRFRIAPEHRHRAMDDARVVYDFLARVQESEDPRRLETAVSEILRANALPAYLDRKIIDRLPEAPGVYLFYGGKGELLYVGKSKNIRDRVHSHFTAGNERAMHQQVCRIDCRETAGELGASLLESRLIKEMRPIYNQMARQKRKVIVARKFVDGRGYANALLDEIDYVDPEGAGSIMAMFRSMTQARDSVREIARSYGLCLKLLGLERAREYCFAYHLKQCQGACMAEEDPAAYNARFAAAFEERRVKAWPYAGRIAIEEKKTDSEGEVFIVDNWCLVDTFKYSEFGYQEHIPGTYTFDYDSYRILARYLKNGGRLRNVKPVPGGFAGEQLDLL